MWLAQLGCTGAAVDEAPAPAPAAPGHQGPEERKPKETPLVLPSPHKVLLGVDTMGPRAAKRGRTRTPFGEKSGRARNPRAQVRDREEEGGAGAQGVQGPSGPATEQPSSWAGFSACVSPVNPWTKQRRKSGGGHRWTQVPPETRCGRQLK